MVNYHGCPSYQKSYSDNLIILQFTSRLVPSMYPYPRLNNMTWVDLSSTKTEEYSFFWSVSIFCWIRNKIRLSYHIDRISHKMKRSWKRLWWNTMNEDELQSMMQNQMTYVGNNAYIRCMEVESVSTQKEDYLKVPAEPFEVGVYVWFRVFLNIAWSFI